MNAAMEWLNEMLPAMKSAAEAKVAAELRDAMRERLPKVFARLERDVGIRAAFVEDRRLAAAVFLQGVADAHFHRFVCDAVVEHVDRNDPVDVDYAVEEVLEACEHGCDVYPNIARPRLPRRSDISRLIHRYCRRGWVMDNGRTVFTGDRNRTAITQ